MKLEEDATWAGKTEQMYVELWFDLPPDRREMFASAFANFMHELNHAVDPMALQSQWEPKLERWIHEIPPLRFLYSARRDAQTGEWIAMMDSFYLIAEKS